MREKSTKNTNLKIMSNRSNQKNDQYFDYGLLAVLIFLMCFGLVMLYSTSAYRALIDYGDSMHYFKRQLIFGAFGFFIMYVTSLIDYRYYIKFGKAIYIFSVFAMALVQTPLGKEVNGAKRWIQLPFDQQLQPAEIAKIAVILFIPVVICKLGTEIKTWKGVITVLGWGGFSAACVLFLTENLSTAIIVAGITYAMIVIVHPKSKWFVSVAAAGVVVAIVGARFLGMAMETSGNFRLRRILVWLNPEKYASEGGYQLMQGLYAIGSGGFFGKGLGNSAQKMVIPEVQNDMILSIICEELGVFGVIMVLVIFGLLIYRLVYIARNAPDMYSSLVVTGIFAHISLQVILNVCVVTNLIPTTGITLPFISYGGTSIIFLMIEMGIALGISRKIKLR